MASGTIGFTDSCNLIPLRSADLLVSGTATAETTVNLSESVYNFAMLTYRLRDTNGDVCAITTIPSGVAINLTIYLYGKDSSTWGRVYISSNATQVTYNRTSATTQKIEVLGVGRIITP